MPDDELLERVRERRARGRSPKEIARALKVRPATVTPLIGVPGALIERSVAVAERRQSDINDCPSFPFRPRPGDAL